MDNEMMNPFSEKTMGQSIAKYEQREKKKTACSMFDCETCKYRNHNYCGRRIWAHDLFYL